MSGRPAVVQPLAFMRSFFARVLRSPRAPAFIALLGLLLVAPALGTGLAADDYFHGIVLRGQDGGPDAIGQDAIPRGLSQLFVWADGTERRARAMMEIGMTGWWTNPALVMAYFRPIAAATHFVDYALWPDAPWLMHLHSIAWLALAWLGAYALYARVLSAPGAAGPSLAAPGAAGPSLAAVLAFALYALDDARAMTVAWIANRNALVALALALPALVLHDAAARAAEPPRRRLCAWLSPLLFGAALLAGEAALALAAYLLAYALFLDPAGGKRGLLRIAPHALLALAWALAYRALGYGSHGSGLVIDPGGQPLTFARKLLERAPVLLAGQVGFPPSDAWEAYPALAPWLPAAMMALALATLLMLGWLLAPIVARDARARFFVTGALLATVPVCAQFPHDRLLPFIGIGAMGALALALAPWLTPGAYEALSRRRRLALAALAGLHLVLAPVWLPLRVRAPLDIERMVRAGERSIDDSPSVRERIVVLMNPPVDAYAGYVPPMRAAEGRPRPRAVYWLATGASDVTLTRLDATTLRVRPAAGFLALPSERMQRDPRDVMPVGHRVPLRDLTIEITALTADRRPAEILARFAYPLEDARYLLLHWERGQFRSFTPPAVGASASLAGVDFASLLP